MCTCNLSYFSYDAAHLLHKQITRLQNLKTIITHRKLSTFSCVQFARLQYFCYVLFIMMFFETYRFLEITEYLCFNKKKGRSSRF